MKRHVLMLIGGILIAAFKWTEDQFRFPKVPVPQCVGDRILHTIACSRTMDLWAGTLRFMHAKNHFSDTLPVWSQIPRGLVRGSGLLSPRKRPDK